MPPKTPKTAPLLRLDEAASGADLWKVRHRTPGSGTWFVIRGTKGEIDDAARRLQASGREVDVSRL